MFYNTNSKEEAGGRHNLSRFRKLGILKNGIPSEATLCRVESGIDDLAMAGRMQEFAETFHRELLKDVLADTAKFLVWGNV